MTLFRRFLSLWLIVALIAWPIPVSHSAIILVRGPVPAAAAGLAITRTQTFGAQSNTASFSAPTAGDLILLYAHHDGNTTAPLKAAGYTALNNSDPTLGTVNTPPTGAANLNAGIAAFRFSDGTETSTGTWTNATSIIGAIYRNAGLGSWAYTRTSGASTSMSYGTLTMAQTNGTSWAVGLGAHRSATNVGTNAPTNMTTRASATDIAIFDTGAGVASWTAATATVSANSGWETWTVELLAVPAGQLLWTLLQHSTAMSFVSATTAAVTLNQSVGSEPHLLVASTQFTSFPKEFVSADKGGTWTSIPATFGADASGGGGSHGYVIGTNTATTPVTLTFAGAASGNTSIWEFAYTGSGTPSLDIANRLGTSGGTTVPGSATVMTGGNDVFVTTASTSNNVVTIAAPFDVPTGKKTITSGNGFASALNRTSAPTPSWTIDVAGTNGMSIVGFGLNSTAFTTNTFADFEASTNGTAVTSALLAASTKGHTGGQWTVVGATPMKFATAASHGLLNSISRLNDGGSVSANAGSLGMVFTVGTTSSQAYQKYEYCTAGGSSRNTNSVSASIWFYSDIPDGNTSNLDVFTLYADGATNFANLKFLPNGSNQRSFELEIPGGSSGATIRYTPGTWANLQIQLNRTGQHHARIYAADGTTVVGNLDETPIGASGMVGNVQFGQTSSNTPTGAGLVMYFDSLKVDPAGTFPLQP